MDITLNLPNRPKFSFSLDYDRNFITDYAIKVCIDREGICEPEVVHLMNRVLREGDFAVDAGACVGFFTLLMSKMVGQTGKVLAFEPGVNNLYKIDENLRLNKTSNVKLVKEPLWHTAGETKSFYLAQDSGINGLAEIPESMGNVVLTTTTFDAHVTRIPRLIKIDIEGAEEQALRGAELVLKATRPPFIICELNINAMARLGSTQESLRRFMQDWRYDMFLLAPNGHLPVHVPHGTKVKSDKKNLNILFSTLDEIELAWPEIEL